MQKLEITTHSAKETQKVARLFARELLKSDFDKKNALVIALEGDLGGGKTTFAQGFARGLGIREKVLSPTFVIMRLHNMRKSNFRIFVHMDTYRIDSTRELRVLGWQGILKDKESIVLVEWADRVRKALPKEYIRVQFEFVDEKTRTIKIFNSVIPCLTRDPVPIKNINSLRKWIPHQVRNDKKDVFRNS